MARTANKTTAVATEPVVNTQAIAELEAAPRALAAMHAGYADERDLANQLLGQIQMSRAISKFTDVVSLQKLKYIKEHKVYRALTGKKGMDRNGNEIPDVGTFDGFCRALGTSASKVDEDLANLDSFGEEALAQLTQAGAGYRELRQYRRLPDDQKTALVEAAKAGDKDSFLELAEDLIAKHAREKEELKKEVQDAQEQTQDLADSKKALETQVTDLRKQARIIAAATPDEVFTHLQGQIATVVNDIGGRIVGELRDAFTQLQDHAAENALDPHAWLTVQLTQLQNYVKTTAAHLDIDLQESASATPEWLDAVDTPTAASVN